MYESIDFRIASTSPMLQHNGQLANPLNEFSRALKAISGKRKKTDADYAEMSRIEFMGGLYVDDGRIVVPGENIEAAFIEGAKKNRLGNQAKAGVICDGNWPLEYDGPKEPEALFAMGPKFVDVRRVVVGTASVMRTRPIFRKWKLGFTINFLPDQLNRAQIIEIMGVVGQIVGLCEYTPKFGRFTVESASATKAAA